MHAHRSAFFVSCFLFCAGCTSAHLVQQPGSTVPAAPNGPVNQASLPGIVEYDHSGGDDLVAQRRADAFNKMSAACQGPYRIDQEGPQVAGTMKNSTDVWVIHFSCVADSAASKSHA